VAQNHQLRFGIATGQRDPWPVLVDKWQEIEALGFDYGWVVDHFLGGEDEMMPYFEAWTLLGGLAAVTEKVRLGIMVCSVTHRNPAFHAKQAITADHISNGRCDFGLGAGWYEREHEAYGYEFPSPGDRVEMFKEALELFESLQDNERTDYHGKHYHFVNTPFEPKSLQQPRMPVVVGASGAKMMDLTAKHADVWNTRSELAEAVEKSKRIDAACEKIGRDPGSLMRSVWPFANQFESVETFNEFFESFYEAGFRDFVFGWPQDEAHVEVMREVANTIIPELRKR
jgi:alkanesulfonate monooxygenase SsuD/methylene tetrahydromethanopterin reductase-like flavin-dependent oxidoreductase (luciferase family)